MSTFLKNYSSSQTITFSKIYFFLIIVSLSQFGTNNPLSKKEIFRLSLVSFSGDIITKIKGTGRQYIISETFPFCPISIKLNDVSVNSVADNCRIIDILEGTEENTIIITFDNNYNYSLQGMF